MTGDKITFEEFQAIWATRYANFHGGTLNRSTETKELLALEVREAIKWPCRWPHTMRGSCTHTANVYNNARRQGKKFSVRCANGVFYALRLE